MALAYDAPSSHAEDGGKKRSASDQAEREDKLLRALKLEEHDALGFHQSEVVTQQIEALQRYFGETYGDEEDGRSQVTTREVFEVINWQLPDYLRVFSEGGNVVTLEANSPDQEENARQAADYLFWIFFSDNPGYQILRDVCTDAMLHRVGYLACYWRDSEYSAPQKLSGLNIAQVMQLQQDQSIEIVAHDFDKETEAGGIDLVVKRVKKAARVEITAIAPEDMRLNGRAVSIDKARYVGRVLRMLRGEACRLWPDKEDEIYGASSAGGAADGNIRRSDDVRQERFQDDRNDYKTPSDPASTEIEVLEEYIRLDLNDDGYPEVIRAYRIQNTILEEEEVEENPFAVCSYRPVPHRFMGLSVHDIAADLQRISTVMMRAALDATYQGVVVREAYDKNKVDLESLLATYSGAKVGVDGPPGDSIMPLVASNGPAESAMAMLQLVKERVGDRTGSSRETRGLDSEALNDTHSGVALSKLQINADAQKEMTARNIGDGLAGLFNKMYRMVCRHQNQPKQARVGGKYCTFDPRAWDAGLSVSVYAGGVNREHTLVGLQMIGMEQDKVLAFAGAGNPNVTVKNRYAYQEELTRQAGYKSAAPYFTDVPDQPVMGPDGQPQVDPQTGQPKMQPYQPPPRLDPQMAKVQADAAANQAKQQQDAQTAAAQLELKNKETTATLILSDKQAKMKLQQDAAAFAQQQQLAQEKAAAELQLAQNQQAAEAALAQQAADRQYDLALRELAMKREIAMLELQQKREMHAEQLDAQTEMHSEKIDATVSMNETKVAADAKIKKNRPGGALDE
jgi:hypothetical protein